MKKIFAYLIIILCLPIVLFGCTDDKNKVQDKDSEFIVGESVSGQIEEIDTSIVSFLVNEGYTIEQAGGIQKILNTIGINNIVISSSIGSGTPTSGLYSIVCYPNGYTEQNRRFYFTTEDGVLFYAGFLNEDLYDSDKGGYLKSYEDVHVPETSISLDTYNTLQQLASEAVKIYLSVPSSADFDSFSWGIGRSDNKYKIQGKLSAKNKLGVKDDLYFSVWFIVTDNGYDIEAVVIDGTRVK